MADKKVLIVDDDPDIVETVKFNLELEKIECVEAYDGEEALIKTQIENPDLILLDVMLPKIHGFKVANVLKSNDFYKKIPIIMLTSRAQEHDIMVGKGVGVQAYVSKPFDMNMLVGLVKKYLSKQ